MNTERAGIYSIENTDSGKVYIGSSINISRRIGEHLRMLHRGEHENKYLQAAWNKYGESKFTFNIKFFCEISELIEQEQKFIDAYTEKMGWRNLYNLNPEASSALGRKHTEQSLKKMSEQQSGDGNGFYGKKHTQESIEKMSASHKGTIPWNRGISWSDETKNKISLARKGKSAWNKGLTKDTDGRVKKYSESKIGVPKWTNGNHPRSMLGKTHSAEAKKKIGVASSAIAQNRKRDSSGRFASEN